MSRSRSQPTSRRRRPGVPPVWCRYAAFLLLVPIAGCGGSGGSSTPAFGLTQRDTVTTLAFPTNVPEEGSLTAVNAFPQISFQQPVAIAAPGDGSDRLCVVERFGRIHIFANTSSVSSTTVFLDITDRVNAGGQEEGLLGLAFDPDYGANGFFYVYYTADAPRRSVISRFEVTANPDLASPASESILLEVAQPFANHNGGMLAFGPDGMLYVSIGDGGSGGDPFANGQNLTTLLGTVLRIRPESNGSYSVPADNPFVGQGGGVRGEIYAYGLRHPWRFSFDAVTGDLWLGDVGQSNREEIDVVEAGGNLGWPLFEGFLEFDNPLGLSPTAFTQPILDYPPSDGVAVIGGHVYRGPTLSSFEGAYIYGDYTSGKIWALVHDDFDSVVSTEVASLPGVSCFGEDESGELLAASLGGTIHRFEENDPGGPVPFPGLLSETGIFTELESLTPAPGILEYDVNLSFWSDNASKRRWIALPGQARIDFAAQAPWNFPLGTVLIKHFELELEVGNPSSAIRLETRVLIRELGGWAGYAYRWNVDETDAVLLDDAESELFTITDPAAPGGERTQLWSFPSRTQCLGCHTPAAGDILGVRTHQLNRDFPYPPLTDSQLRAWNHIGLFTNDIGDATSYGAFPRIDDADAGLAARARAYLDVNCANCHRPNGPTPVDIDLRFHVDADEMGIFGVAPVAGDLGLPGALLVSPGVKEASVLWERLRRLDGDRMPPLGSHVVDDSGVDLIGEWIDSGS